MKQEDIKQLFEQFESASSEVDGIEVWSARELYPLFGYSLWRNFEMVIEKAKEACRNVGNETSDHFADVSKMIQLPNGAEREIDDVLLTRYACYLVAPFTRCSLSAELCPKIFQELRMSKKWSTD